MQSRERLWRRVSGQHLWPLAWALAAASAVPWMVPETWDGTLRTAWIAAGWSAVALSALLLRSRRFAVVPLAAALCWGTVGNLRQRVRWEQSLPAGIQVLEGEVAAPWTPQGARLESSLRIAAPAPLRGLRWKMSLPWPPEESRAVPPAPGTPVRVRAELRPVDPAPRFLVERPLWRARSDRTPRSIHLASALQFEVLGPPRPGPLLRMQAFVRKRFDALPLSDPTARDLWGALALGIPPVHEDTTSAFAESGTLHILVVSGLQVTLVMAAVESLLRRLLGRGGTAGAMVAGLGYAALVGFSAPVWRGFFMGLAWASGGASGWKLPPVLGLHLALLLWLLGHPAAGCEPGFLLAWWALLSLAWCAEPLAGLLSPLLGRAALPLARFAAPWLATFPLLALFHGGVPLWGIAANLVVLPLVAFLTPLCLAMTLVPVPGATQAVGSLLAWTGSRAVPFFAGVTPLATAALWPWILLALGWLALAHLQSRMARTRAWTATLAAATALLLAAGGTGRRAAALSLEAFDIGQGDALLLRVPDGDATLLDTGPGPWAGRRIARALSRRGVMEPVHLVLTHPHSDHAGGWSTLARLRPLASVDLPVLADAQDPWTPYRPAKSGIGSTLRRGDRWRRGDAEFSVRWPPKPFDLPDPNMVSAVLRVRWRDRELWLMGDALQVQERDLLDAGDPGPSAGHRLLKVGHHGSLSASAPAWIAALQPDLALIPAGRRNPFGHPHEETLQTLRASGTPVHVTGADRGDRIEARPGGWSLERGDGGSGFIPCRTIPIAAPPR